ncbi:uncharacterized protein LOC133181059 [Saccostrea echinata]|uniref:uncharacterized protein LOC133181059 n=1 Tax=Saccostrea echinata TaxID=191078 RepID=UPI002A82ABEE|nr:uncharacterized protein LOC133181059 [Saccostrea echinata]
MQSLIVFVVLLAVFHGSLSTQSKSDELRGIVRQLEGLVAREWKGKPRPTSIPSEPRGPTDKGSDPSSRKYDRMIKMFFKLLKPYFGTFPSGNYTSDMPVDKIVEMMNEWYKNMPSKTSDPKAFRKWAFFNMARVLLRAHFQCATAKINQIIFYVLKAQERAMTANDKSMYESIRTILENWINGTEMLDRATRRIVGAAHRHVFGEIMSHIKYFQFKDTIDFFQKVKPFIKRAIREKWTVFKFDEKLRELLSNFDFGCPGLDDFLEFHRKLAVSFKQRFSEDTHFKEAERWLTANLPRYINTDPAPVLPDILQVYTGYVNAAVRNFEQVEVHMTTGNTDDIANFMSTFLTPDQLEYLKAIFEFLKATGTDSGDTDSSNNMDVSSYSVDED